MYIYMYGSLYKYIYIYIYIYTHVCIYIYNYGRIILTPSHACTSSGELRVARGLALAGHVLGLTLSSAELLVV